MNINVKEIINLMEKIGYDYGTWINSPISRKYGFITKEQYFLSKNDALSQTTHSY